MAVTVEGFSGSEADDKWGERGSAIKKRREEEAEEATQHLRL